MGRMPRNLTFFERADCWYRGHVRHKAGTQWYYCSINSTPELDAIIRDNIKSYVGVLVHNGRVIACTDPEEAEIMWVPLWR